MGQQPKTVEQRLQELPEPQRTQALTNAPMSNKVAIPDEDEELSSVLQGAFNWDKTPEGFKYWANVFDNLIVEERQSHE